jgi:integrase
VPENSVVTVNGDLRTLRRLFKLAVEWGRLDKAPTIREMPQSKGRDRVVSFAEEALYLAKASDNLRDAAILAVDTGTRPNSELFPIKWADVDLTASTEAPHGMVHIRQGKTDSAPCPSPRVLLTCYRGTSSLCSTPKALAGAGLKSFEYYCWRHTFGTRAARSGMDRFKLARLMGHSSPSVAARYYIHVTETHVAAGFGKFVEYQTRNVAEGLAAAFPQASGAVQ